MKKFPIAASVLALAAAISLTSCAAGTGSAPKAERDAITSGADATAVAAVPEAFRESGVVRVAAGIPYPPFILTTDEGGYEGFDVDMAQALGEKLDLDFQISHQAFETVIPSLQSNKFDIIMAGMNDTTEREKTLNFVDYVRAGFTIVVKSGNPEDITTLLDLCGKSVAVQKSTVQGKILRDLVAECESGGSKGVEVQELPVANDAQTALKAGRVQAYVTDAPVAAFTIATAGGGKDFEGIEDPKNPQGFSPVYSGIGMLRKEDGLAEAIRLGLQSMVDDGVYQEILEEHGMGHLAVTEAKINSAGLGE